MMFFVQRVSTWFSERFIWGETSGSSPMRLAVIGAIALAAIIGVLWLAVGIDKLV